MTRALNILGWVGTALVFGAFAAKMLGMAGTITVSEQINQYSWYATLAGLALVVLYTLSQWREIAAYFKHRNARYGAIAILSVIAVLGILVAINYVSFRQNKRWDLTANRQFSLSDQTIKLLQGLTAPVKVTVFDQQANLDRFRTRLSEYQYQTKQVSVDYVDAVRNPLQARQYEIQTIPTVVMEYMGRTERTSSDGEQDLTNALIKLLNPTKRKVYFLGGHGEKDPGNSDRTAGYSDVAASLKRDNYEFDKLVLAQANEIPADATILVIAGPRTDLLEQEVPLLGEYLSKQGKLFVLMDPPQNLKQPVAMPRLTALLAEWGITATESVVVDVSGRTTVATVPVAGPPYPSHAITDRFDLITMFPIARAILPAANAPAGRSAQSFVQTAQRSWAETTFSELDNPKELAPETDKGDTAGPVSIAAAVAVAQAEPADAANAKKEEQPSKPETRIAAIGDSDFAANATIGVEGNADLFMNTLNWLAQQENLIAIRPREASDRRITMTPSQATGMFWMTVVLIPAVVLSAGVYTWWRRR